MNNETLLPIDKVLIVEDDKAIRDSLQDILEFNGFQVFTAINGKSGLVAVLKEKPSLVICDINMPIMNGYELLESLNECMDKELVPPFLFLTARTTTADVRKGMELGADDFITKPFDALNLLEVVISKITKRKKILSFAVIGEQDRISEELHDNIQQLLVASQMGFKSIQDEIKILDDDIQNVFNNSLAFLKEASVEVRSVSHQMSGKKEVDLKAKIENLFKQLNDIGEIETHFSYNVEKEIENTEKIELLRIIQETLNNCIKYSSAKNIFLTISSNELGLKVEIKDDGIGFDMLNSEKGNGIINMKKRAKKIGACLEIKTYPKKGTIITIFL